jgi:hypothetical protein
VDLWATDDSTQAVAVPNHQVSFDVTVILPWQSTINFNGFITDGYKAYGVAPLDGMGAVVYNSIQKYDPLFILNVYYQIAYKGFELGLGISDLTGEKQAIASYDRFQSPVQQMGREVYLRFAYTF